MDRSKTGIKNTGEDITSLYLIWAMNSLYLNIPLFFYLINNIHLLLSKVKEKNFEEIKRGYGTNW